MSTPESQAQKPKPLSLHPTLKLHFPLVQGQAATSLLANGHVPSAVFARIPKHPEDGSGLVFRHEGLRAQEFCMESGGELSK